MATADSARRQMKRDVGDYWYSTLTSNGDANGHSIKDSKLLDERPNEFLKERSFLLLPSGVTGSGSDEERRIQMLSHQTGELLVFRAFSAQVDSAQPYEVHRFYSGADCDDMITEALTLLNSGILFKKEVKEITTVTDQLHYDISSHSWINNWPRQVHLVSSSETEDSLELLDWEVTYKESDTKPYLKLRSEISGSKTLRLFGHVPMAVTDLSDGEELIVAARAGMLWCQRGAADFPAFREEFERRFGIASGHYNERLMKFAPVGYPATQRFSGFRNPQYDISWYRT